MSNSPLNTHAANAVHVMRQCEAFANKGLSVNLYAISNVAHKKYFNDYHCEEKFSLCLDQRGSYRYISPLFYAAKQVIRASRVEGYKILYCRCALSAFLAIRSGHRVIFEVHELPHSFLLSYLYRQILKSKDLLRLVVISESLKIDLLRHFELSECELDIVVAHDGASIPKCATTDKFDFDSRNYSKVIGYAGGLRTGNGIQLILDLANEYPDVLFALAGGEVGDVQFWKEKVVSENVLFLGKILPRDVSKFLSECDVLIAPYALGPKTTAGNDTSRWMSPLKVFEYMAVGKPIVVSDFPVLREVLSDETALLVAPEDLAEWKVALNTLLTDETYARVLGCRAYQTLCSKYTWDRRAEAILSGLL